MYLILIGWLYVALMMAAAEATAANGTVLGALITFVLYGLAPVALVGYLLDAPRRRRAIAAREASERLPDEPAAASVHPDTGAEAPAAAEPDRVAPVRKKP